MSKKVSFSSSANNNAPQRNGALPPPDVGMALGNVMEREFNLPQAVDAVPRRARKAGGASIFSSSISPQTQPACESKLSANPVLQGVSTAGFPKATSRFRPNANASVPTEEGFGGVGGFTNSEKQNTAQVPLCRSVDDRSKSHSVYHDAEGDVVNARDAPVHVDREGLYSRALYGEGITTLHERRPDQLPLQEQHSGKLSLQHPKSNSLFSSVTPLTQDLTAEELTLAGAIVSSDDIAGCLSELLEKGSIEFPLKQISDVKRTVSGGASQKAPPYLPSTLRLLLKLLRSPVLSHNVTGVTLLSCLCMSEASAWVAVLWGGAGGDGTAGAQSSATARGSSLSLKDDYEKFHQFLTEGGQDPCAALQAQFRFAGLGTGGLLAETTTASPDTAANEGLSRNAMDWPDAATTRNQLDQETQRQLVYQFHKALSPARILDTVINKNIRAATGYKRPCPNMFALSSCLSFLSNSLLLKPSAFDDILQEVMGGGIRNGVHPRLLAGIAACEANGERKSDAPDEGLDHDAVDVLLAGSRGDGNRSKALDTLGLTRVIFNHVLPILKEADGGDAMGEDISDKNNKNTNDHHEASLPSDRRATLSILWALMADPLVTAQTILGDYLLVTNVLSCGGDASSATKRYHARYYDLFISVFDAFLMKDVLLAGMDISQSHQLVEDVSLLCSLLTRVCLGIVGVAVGSFTSGSVKDDMVASHVALCSIVLAKCADTIIVLAALLDGCAPSTATAALDSPRDYNAALVSLWALQQATLDGFMFAAEMRSVEVAANAANEGVAPMWAWAEAAGEDFVQLCGVTLVGHFSGVSSSGTPVPSSLSAAALLLRPFIRQASFSPKGSAHTQRKWEHLLYTVEGADESLPSVWVRKMRALVEQKGIIAALIRASTQSRDTVERVLCTQFITCLLPTISDSGTLTKFVGAAAEELSFRFSGDQTVIAQVARWVSECHLLPLVGTSDATDRAVSETVSPITMGDSMSSAALALQVRVAKEWQKHHPPASEVPRADSLVCHDVLMASSLNLLLTIINTAPALGSHYAQLLEGSVGCMLLGEGLATRPRGGKQMTLVPSLLSRTQITLLDLIASALLSDVLPSATSATTAPSPVTSPIIRQFCVLMCALLSHPEHKEAAPPHVVAGYAIVAGSTGGDWGGAFTGADKLLFSLTLSYLQSHHNAPARCSEEGDGADEDSEEQHETTFSNVFVFRDPPLEWFYSEGQVYREAVLDEVEAEDGDESAGAVLEEERRKLFTRHHYNERQGFAAWLLWLSGIVRASSRGGGSVSNILLHVDELLVDMWLWRMRLASVGVSMTRSEVAEFTAAVTRKTSNGDGEAALVELHTIHVGEACDILFEALLIANGFCTDVEEGGKRWHGMFMRSGALKKIVDSMPNITATLGFVPVPSSVCAVSLALLHHCAPPPPLNLAASEKKTLVNPTPTSFQIQEQRLRAQVFTSLARLVCVIASQQSDVDLLDPRSTALLDLVKRGIRAETPAWWAWNSQQFADVLVAVGPTLKRLDPACYSSGLTFISNILRSQLRNAVPRLLIHQQCHASSYGAYRWGAESSEATWEMLDELGIGKLFTTV